ncbi:hypothetical protein EW146_g1336 [Bondarzewia mesenterica]|uniref:tripeptidyl-peptidase II n=1 Tax=Bondarzewia mesenterica TaxID=1095465 RepID=A0A4S4M454_9AGAM|nr:hypothetical protein EW146_g1336 [Bondarzewia mesenterica]
MIVTNNYLYRTDQPEVSPHPIVYTHGHSESVLRSHSWRTAANSAGYLLSYLKPDMHILDIGCGPGTITIDLAKLVPQGQVVGLEPVPDPLEKARATAAAHQVDNVQFVVGDIHALDYPDGTFDVVHVHQVLQHAGDPVQALREMRRVAKPGGIVAARESDSSAFFWYPDVEGMNDFQKLYQKVARSNGGEPDAGRRLHVWAKEAGFSRADITLTTSTWCFASPEEVAWWSGLWADRIFGSLFAKSAIEWGHATKEELERFSETWRRWGAQEDAVFVVPHGEIICRVCQDEDHLINIPPPSHQVSTPALADNGVSTLMMVDSTDSSSDAGSTSTPEPPGFNTPRTSHRSGIDLPYFTIASFMEPMMNQVSDKKSVVIVAGGGAISVRILAKKLDPARHFDTRHGASVLRALASEPPLGCYAGGKAGRQDTHSYGRLLSSRFGEVKFGRVVEIKEVEEDKGKGGWVVLADGEKPWYERFELAGEIKELWPSGFLPFSKIYPDHFRKRMQQEMEARGVMFVFDGHRYECEPTDGVVHILTLKGYVRVTPGLELPDHPGGFCVGEALENTERCKLDKFKRHAAVIAANVLDRLNSKDVPHAGYQGGRELIGIPMDRSEGKSLHGLPLSHHPSIMLRLLAIALILGRMSLASPTASPHILKEHVTPSPRWVSLGAAPAEHILSLRIALPQPNFATLEKHLHEVSDPTHARYGAHLSKEEVEDLVAPHSISIAAVDAWLLSHGIPESECMRSPARDWVTIKVPVRLAEKMLATCDAPTQKYHVWKHSVDGDVMVRTTSYSLPQALHEHIELIQPTTMFARLRSASSSVRFMDAEDPTSGPEVETSMITDPVSGMQVDASCNRIITIKCLQQLYNMVGYTPSATNGNQIGITGYLDQWANLEDLKSFYEDQRLATVNPSFSVTLINGGQNDQNLDKAGSEASLDVQYAFGLTDPIPGTFYSTAGQPPFIADARSTSNTNEPYAEWLDYVLGQSVVSQTISTSYGDDEQTVPKSYAQRICRGLAQLGVRGVSLLFSSGDFGVGDGDGNPETQKCFTNDDRNAMRFIPIFPATCPYVTSVGGTQHVPEVAVSRFFSGGGFSDYFDRPSYQNDSVLSYLDKLPSGTYDGLYNPNGRAFPDVSAQGDFFRIFFKGKPRLIGGTSASSPAFAAVVSLLNDARVSAGLPTLGFLNPLLYSKGMKGLNDITVGNSTGCGTSGFNASEGWDPVTGLGTPNFGKLKDIVMAG